MHTMVDVEGAIIDIEKALQVPQTAYSQLQNEQERTNINLISDGLQKTAHLIKNFLASTKLEDSAILHKFDAYIDPEVLVISPRPTVLGAGGFGIVFEGEFQGTQVAIKISKANADASAADFKNEVAMLVRIQPCPHIVAAKGFCIMGANSPTIEYEYLGETLKRELKDTPCIILELRGQSLRLILDQILRGRIDPIPWRLRLKIAIDIATAISFLHSCGLLHLDLKPGNILVDKFYSARLCDFGAAAFASTVNDPNLRNKPIFYTPGYAPPTFDAPGHLITHRNDLYAFGKILQDLCLGANPPPPQVKLLIQNCCHKDTPLTASAVTELLTDIYDNFQGWDQDYPCKLIRHAPKIEPAPGTTTRAMKKKLNVNLLKTGSTVQSPSSASSTPSIDTMMAGLDLNDSLVLVPVAPTVANKRTTVDSYNTGSSSSSAPLSPERISSSSSSSSSAPLSPERISSSSSSSAPLSPERISSSSGAHLSSKETPGSSLGAEVFVAPPLPGFVPATSTDINKDLPLPPPPPYGGLEGNPPISYGAKLTELEMHSDQILSYGECKYFDTHLM
jgi:serine/threonine protein kinase